MELEQGGLVGSYVAVGSRIVGVGFRTIRTGTDGVGGLPVKAVRVLRENRLEVAVSSQRGQRLVGGVRLVLLVEHRPLEVDAVVPEARGIAPEPAVGELPLIEVLPDAVVAAEGGDARRRGDTGAGQRDGRLGASDLVGEVLEVVAVVRCDHIGSSVAAD